MSERPIEKRLKRDAKRKQKRLALERARNELSTARKRLRTDAPITALRLEAKGEIVIGVRRGLFGHPNDVVLRVDDTSIVGCVEDRAELAKLVNNVGLLVVSQLFRHDLAEGVDGLGKSIATWAGIDLDKLAAEAAADDAPVPTDYSCPQCGTAGLTPDSLQEHLAGCKIEPEAPVL